MSSGDGEGRVPGVGDDGPSSAAGRRPEPSPDPSSRPFRREAEITALLREVGRGGVGVGPDAETSRRMRAKLMAAIGAPADDTPDHDDHHDPASADDDVSAVIGVGAPAGGRRARPGVNGPGRPRPGGRPRRSAARRPDRSRPTPSDRRIRRLSRATGALCAVLALGVLAVVLSRGALPGEVLYGLKRTSESAELAMTSGPEATARKHLDVAELRLDEVSEMIRQDSAVAPAGAGSVPLAPEVDPGQAALITDNLREFDAQTREGVRLLLPLTALPSGPPPSLVFAWARAQSDHLDAVAPALVRENGPAVLSARSLLDRVTTRAEALDEPGACPRTGSDEWGPVPACAPPTAAPSTPADPDPTTPSASPSTSTNPTTTTVPDTRGDAVTSTVPVPVPVPVPAAPVRPVVPAPLPPLPLPLPLPPKPPLPPNVSPPAVPLPVLPPVLPRGYLPPFVPGVTGLGGG